eukprot:TRINITY_DN520_c1_g1_i2.p3 TRINITY_DN520_c1_g1~~TRINITY_DN520_c1_g1_i2.p3  ORF type:complete len:126 (+),score=3.75 TRINITY_DN520_c1_g1_i2:1001-1378(+)
MEYESKAWEFYKSQLTFSQIQTPVKIRGPMNGFCGVRMYRQDQIIYFYTPEFVTSNENACMQTMYVITQPIQTQNKKTLTHLQSKNKVSRLKMILISLQTIPKIIKSQKMVRYVQNYEVELNTTP